MKRRERMLRGLDQEIRDHIEMATQDNIDRGMSPEEAHYAAVRKFGNVTRVQEDTRAVWSFTWFENALQDVRFGLRKLRKSPGFTIVAVLTLALGIGANTAIFHLIDAVRLRSLPVRDPQSLVSIQIKGGNHGFGINAGDESLLTYPLWEQIRDHQTSLSGAFAWESWDFNVGLGAQKKSVIGLWVSGEMFRSLGILPEKGRFLTTEDDRAGCGTPGVVLSYAFWRTQFGSDESIVGQKLIVDSHPIEIIGVAPAKFTGLEIGKAFDIAVPFCSGPALNSKDTNLSRREFFWVLVMGHLKSGVTLAHASAELETLSRGMIEATVPSGYSEDALKTYHDFRLTALPAGGGISNLRQSYSASLWLLLGITGLVLLIACANIANLMLVRSSVRGREMAVRLALGASYWRLATQMITESLLLAGTGAALGLVLAKVFSHTLISLIRTEGDRLQLDLSLDWRVLLFVSAVAITTSVVFGLAPAFESLRKEPVDALKSGGPKTGSRQSHAFQRVLVVSQIAISLVLLVGAFLFVLSFWNLTKVDPGFRQDGVLIAYMGFDKMGVTPEHYDDTSRQLLAQIRSIPLVESAATSTHLPFNGSWTSGVDVGGVQGQSKFSWVSPGYLRTLQIPLAAGRDFNDRDTATSPRVAIVSQSFVHKFLGAHDPIGKVIRTAPEPDYPAAVYEIIGVAKDTKYTGLREETPPAEAYAPSTQFPAPGPDTAVLIRSSAPLSAVSAAVRDKVTSASSEIDIEFVVLKKSIEDRMIRERMLALLSGSFGFLALILAMIGLYGVISYIVTLRRAEIGIRMALGASRKNIVTIVLGQTLSLTFLGIAVGALLAPLATRGAAALLYGIRPQDPFTLVAASVFLGSVALCASVIPARRATLVDPMIALRYE
jgi:predicted permease